MENKITPIIVKKEGVSDAFYKVVELYAENGNQIEEGDPVLCFETSKTAIDMEAPTSGYIFFDVEEHDEITIGQAVAVISEMDSIPEDYFTKINGAKKNTSKTASKNPDVKISKPALRLIETNDIDIKTAFAGKSLITKDDVETYLGTQNSTKPIEVAFKNNSLLIIGGGGHAKMCIDIIQQDKSFEIAGIADANSTINSSVFHIPVISRDDSKSIDLLIEQGLKNVVLGIGAVLNHSSRKTLFDFLKSKDLFVPNIIHPTASIEPSAVIGEGNQIMQGAIIGSDVQIGDNCIINSSAIISHDTKIGDNVHIAPGAIIAGGVTIASNTVIGMGVTLFLGIKIGENVMINNGINIFNDVPNNEIIKEA